MAYRFGLVGHRIGYSLSPQIFEWLFTAAKISGSYRLWDVPPNGLKFMIAEGKWDGLNVTNPFKTEVLACCTDFGDAASDAGAVNVLRRSMNHLRGENTDGVGFIAAVKRAASLPLKFERALMVGSGGAARACAAALLHENAVSDVQLASRTPDAKHDVLPAFLQSVKMISLDTARQHLNEFDLVVQATPIGSVTQPGMPLPGALTFHEDALVVDLIYTPRETKFMQAAKRKGAHVMNGLPMLIAQATASLKIWSGAEISPDAVIAELLPHLEAA